MLPEIDREILNERSPQHTIQAEGGMICVLVPDYPLGPGFDRETSDLLLRLSPGYPDVPPDMWWFHPPVRRVDGAEIAATQSVEHYLGRAWQRWSRHLQPGQWRSGVDTLRSFLALVRKEVRAAAPAGA